MNEIVNNLELLAPSFPFALGFTVLFILKLIFDSNSEKILDICYCEKHLEE